MLNNQIVAFGMLLVKYANKRSIKEGA